MIGRRDPVRRGRDGEADPERLDVAPGTRIQRLGKLRADLVADGREVGGSGRIADLLRDGRALAFARPVVGLPPLVAGSELFTGRTGRVAADPGEVAEHALGDVGERRLTGERLIEPVR